MLTIRDGENRLNKSVEFLLVFAGILALAVLMVLSPQVDWLWEQIPIHSVVEAVGSLALIALALILANLSHKDTLYGGQWFCLGLFCMGYADLAHSVVEPGNLFVWFHSLAIFFGGVLSSLVWFNAESKSVTKSLKTIWFLTLIGLLFAGFFVFSPGSVPDMLREGVFTPAALVLNIGGGIGFLATAFWFLKYYFRTRNRSALVFFFICVLNAAAGLFFQYSHLWDFGWWLWHVFRLITALIALGYMGSIIRQNLLAAGERDQFKLLLTQVQEQKRALELISVQRGRKGQLHEEIIGLNSKKQLGNVLLRNLASACNIQVGLFYVVGNKGELFVSGHFSHPDPDSLASVIPAGEGALGVAVLEKRPVLLTDFPEDYMTLKSGTCSVPLKQIYIHPFLHGGMVIALVELGSVTEVSDEARSFVADINESIVASVIALNQ